jgi:hypothetical protein
VRRPGAEFISELIYQEIIEGAVGTGSSGEKVSTQLRRNWERMVTEEEPKHPQLSQFEQD